MKLQNQKTKFVFITMISKQCEMFRIVLIDLMINYCSVKISCVNIELINIS